MLRSWLGAALSIAPLAQPRNLVLGNTLAMGLAVGQATVPVPRIPAR